MSRFVDLDVGKPCACGCGQTIRPIAKPQASRQRRFMNGHRLVGGRKTASDIAWWVGDRGYVVGRIRLADGSLRKVKQHRYFMELALGRSLRPDEDVHHKDGNKQNNDLSNLELLSHSAHRSIHASELGKKWRTVKRHQHKRPSTCCCSIQALEPDDDCPIHSGGEWPPRCVTCGQFMAYREVPRS